MSSAVGAPRARMGTAWLKVLGVGIVLYFLSLFIMIVTSNTNLFPTVVMVGNFLVPVAFVAFFYERRSLSTLSLPSTGYTFFYGGILGVLASSLLEPVFVRQTNPSTLLIGLIEEGAKILGVWLIARRRQHDSEMDGVILGAAAGMGFAALESMGYTFTAFLMSGGSLTATVSTTLLRGVLAPAGHGVWTAILAAVLFRESRGTHFRLNGKVIAAYLGVSVLHALWDGLPTFVANVFGSGLDVLIAQGIIGAIGFFILWRLWVQAKRLQIEQQNRMEAEQAMMMGPVAGAYTVPVSGDGKPESTAEEENTNKEE